MSRQLEGTPQFTDPEVAEVFNAYPKPVRKKLLFLRKLVLETAAETEGVGTVQEALKWGEPSYIAKYGSAIRMDWKPNKPEKYAMYFHCQTKLVDAFRELYGSTLVCEGNRAIVFGIEDPLPIQELKHCISLALTYHRRKHLPLLGA